MYLAFSAVGLCSVSATSLLVPVGEGMGGGGGGEGEEEEVVVVVEEEDETNHDIRDMEKWRQEGREKIDRRRVETSRA